MIELLNITFHRSGPAVAGAGGFGQVLFPLPRMGSCGEEHCRRHGAGFSAGATAVYRHRGGNRFSRLAERNLAGRDADGSRALRRAATRRGVTFFLSGGCAMLAMSLPQRRRSVASDRGRPKASEQT